MAGVKQPSGQVTLVFTDIEGSTRLLHELGTERYREALAAHRRVVREACARHSGYEVDYEGDAFFYAFSTAEEAVAAVSQAMAGLEQGPIRIRVGIHTGAPGLDAPKYVGLDVHLAARIMSAAHGGQVVCSRQTAALVDAELTELGEHRLKDIVEPVSLFQLGEGSFPPLKTISNTNLPRPASSFVGREEELAEVLARLEAGARLLTLTGPGGTGKTRLALEAASTLVPQYKAGVFWVGLATLRDPALVPEQIAQTLGAKDSLAAHIAERELLLLLDNLEQVVECAPELSALLSVCRNLTLLCTSRELLRIQGEVEYPVPPLATPEAVELFCTRSGLEPTDEIAELCLRLDSLPLAVELAAARSKALTPAQILERLASRLDLLKGGRDSDPRQQTLRATIEWSYELLTEDEQRLFAALSVFAGGCTLEAAEEVAEADLDTLQSLVEKSLLRFTASDSGGRYWMLETIREYAGERMDRKPDAAAIRERQASWCVALAEAMGEKLWDPSASEIASMLDDELANIRAALSWFGANQRSSDELRLLRALKAFWLTGNHLTEGEAFLSDALNRIPDDGSELRLSVERGFGEIAWRRGKPDIARRIVERWLEAARRDGDRSKEAWALSALASISTSEADFPRSVALLEEALEVARPIGDELLLSNILGNLGYALSGVGQYERAVIVGHEALASTPGHLDDCVGHANVGLALIGLGDLRGAAEQYRLTVEHSLESGLLFVLADGLVGAAAIALKLGEPGAALTVLAAADRMRSELGIAAEPLEHELAIRTAEGARSLLDAEHAEELSREGIRLTVEQAAELALASIA